MAKLIFNYSAMNSGKTMDLLRTAYNYEENDLKIIVMKPSVDTKGGNKIVTRVGLDREVDYLIDEDCDIYELLCDKVDGVKCIFVDEAQFLSVNHVNQLFKVTKLLDVPVICYGLRTNFKSELFSGSMRLLALADELNEFKSLCHCGNMARFNGRRLNGKYLSDGDNILIDGSSEVEYVPLCGECYLQDVLGKNNVPKVKKMGTR